MENKILYIGEDRETIDQNRLINRIYESGFVDGDTVLINCQPDFSSILTQRTNHKMSFVNNNSLFESYSLEIPTKGMKQIWNRDELEFQSFDLYLHSWVKKYTSNKLKYLFLASVIHSEAYNKLTSLLKGTFSEEQFMVACVYLSELSSVVPDLYVEKVPGRVLFSWENSDCKDRIF